MHISELTLHFSDKPLTDEEKLARRKEFIAKGVANGATRILSHPPIPEDAN